MRAPSHRSSDDEAAIEEASRSLRRLFVDVFSWSEWGADTKSPEKKLKAALALVEGVLADVEQTLFERAPYNQAIPFIALARKAAIPELRQARPPKGRWGQHSDLNASRNQTIADTVASIREQFEVSQEQAASFVSEALKRLVLEHKRVFSGLTKERADVAAWIPADPACIDECLKFVDKLSLEEDTVEDIAKRYRTVPE